MTKEITKAKILQQLQDKFGLREWETQKFLFDEVVVPTYDIGREVQQNTSDFREVSVTAGPALYHFFAVPKDERWHLMRYNVIFMAAGAYKVTGVFIVRETEQTPNSTIYLDMVLNQTVSYAIDLPKAVVLEPLDDLYVYVDHYTSTAALRLYIDYVMEEIR